VYKSLAATHREFANAHMADKSVLAAIASMDDSVPESLVHTCAVPITQEQADELVDGLGTDSQGYASTRTGSAEDPSVITPFSVGKVVDYLTDTGTWMSGRVAAMQMSSNSCSYSIQVQGEAGGVTFFANATRVKAAVCGTCSTFSSFHVNDRAFYHRLGSTTYQPCRVEAIVTADEQQAGCYRVRDAAGHHWLANHSELHSDVMPMEGVDEFDIVFDPQSEMAMLLWRLAQLA
jgi:hypothetical protein